MTIRTTGNSRPWEHRPSDHRAGMRGYWHGRLEPLEPPRTGLRLTDRLRENRFAILQETPDAQ